MESKLRGFNALASSQTALSSTGRKVSDDARLTQGPAFGKRAGNPPASVGSWPTYRHNARRQGIASTEVDAALKQTWSTDIGGRLTQPVIAGGKIVVASIDRHTVVALHERNGAVAWTFTCGGRVDSPPTLHKGRVLFGSADGCVYCLGLVTGELAWRFACAPMDLRTVSYDQLESLWPVHGSLIVLDDVAYCSAGRSTWLDGGLYLYALDPITGKLLHSRRFESHHPEYGENKDQAEAGHEKRVDQNVTDYKTFLQPDRSDAFSMAGGAISDVLVSDGADVFLHHARFNTRLEPQEAMSRHLFSTSSLLDDNENHRSHWVLGTGDFSLVPVAYSWIANANGAQRKGTSLVPPGGLMLVYDDDAVWGLHRNGKSDGNYTVFQRANKPLREDRRGQPDFAKLPEGEDPYPYVWKTVLPARPRALVKAGDLLFVAGATMDAPEGDPHAPYEGRTGGVIRVLDAQSGQAMGTFELESPVVWDGMAAAAGHLYAATCNGHIVCLGD
jgi:outer membrane protein assembly factor BamB